MSHNHPINTKIESFLVGRTSREIAEACGLSVQAINNYVLGYRKPNEEVMPIILTVLGKPWNRILNEDEVWPYKLK